MGYKVETQVIVSPGWRKGSMPLKVLGGYSAVTPGKKLPPGAAIHVYMFNGLFEMERGAASIEFDEPQRIECLPGQSVRFQVSANDWPILLLDLTPEEGQPMLLSFKRGEALQFELTR